MRKSLKTVRQLVAALDRSLTLIEQLHKEHGAACQCVYCTEAGHLHWAMTCGGSLIEGELPPPPEPRLTRRRIEKLRRRFLRPDNDATN